MATSIVKKIKSFFEPSTELEVNSPTIEAIARTRELYTIGSLFSYESYCDERDLYHNVDSIGFILECSPATGLGEQEMKALHSVVDQGITDGVLQVSIVASPKISTLLDEWSSKKSSGNQEHSDFFEMMAQKRVDHLKNGNWSSLFDSQPFVLRDYKLVISYMVPVNTAGAEDRLVKIRPAISEALKTVGIPARNLDPHGLLNLLYPFINPGAPECEVQYNPNELVSSQIANPDTSLRIHADSIDLSSGNEHYSVLPYHVRQLPQEWSGVHNYDLIGSFSRNERRFGCPFIATMCVYYPDQNATKAKASRNHIRATQMADTPVAKYVPQWKDRKTDWEYTNKRMQEGDTLVQSFFDIVLFAPKDKAFDCAQTLESLYSSLGWQISRSKYCPQHSLLANLPLALTIDDHRHLFDVGHYRSRHVSACTKTAPWIGEWKGTENPLMLFSGRRGQLTGLSHFDNKSGNYNIACAATSGAGKSFLAQDVIFSVLGDGGRVFVIDAGGSYKEICSILGGAYIDFAESAPKLNPFSKLFRDVPKGQSVEYRQEFMPLLVELLGQMASPQDALSKQGESYLEQAIFMAVGEKEGATTISDVRDACLELRDGNNQPIELARDIADSLHSFCKEGMYGRYFDGDSDLDLNNPFVVLELDGIRSKEQLKSIVLFMLMIEINQAMYLSGNRSQKKQVVIDEAWALMGGGRTGKFIEEGYRVARKYGGSYMTITQGIKDYFTSESARAAYDFSDFKFILRQEASSLVQAEKLGQFNNDSGQIDLLKSLKTVQGKYSEIAVLTPNGISVVRLVVDPYTAAVYSTTPSDTQFIRNQMDEGASLDEAVTALVGMKS